MLQFEWVCVCDPFVYLSTEMSPLSGRRGHVWDRLHKDTRHEYRNGKNGQKTEDMKKKSEASESEGEREREKACTLQS